jgi:hypothetical protein
MVKPHMSRCGHAMQCKRGQLWDHRSRRSVFRRWWVRPAAGRRVLALDDPYQRSTIPMAMQCSLGILVLTISVIWTCGETLLNFSGLSNYLDWLEQKNRTSHMRAHGPEPPHVRLVAEFGYSRTCVQVWSWSAHGESDWTVVSDHRKAMLVKLGGFWPLFLLSFSIWRNHWGLRLFK